MKKTEYFQEILAYVRISRAKLENFSKDEKLAYDVGKRDAFLEILRMLHRKEEMTIWENDGFTEKQLCEAIHRDIKHIIQKLRKARRVYLAREKLLKSLQQTSLEDLINVATAYTK